MHILYLHQFFATHESDLGLIRSYEFSQRMLAEGHRVTMVTSSSRLPEPYQARTFTRGDVDGIDVRSVRVRYSNYMGYGRRISSFALFTLGATWLALRAPKPDVVFATSTPLTVGIPGLVAARGRGIPFVFEVRDLWPEAAIQMGALRRDSLAGRAAKWLERFLYRHSDAIVGLSPGMVDGIVAEGVDPARTHMIPNCSDLDLFVPADKDPQIVRRFGLGERFVVGYTGAIGPSNAVERSVPQAARILAERGRTDIVFLLVGEGKSLPEVRRLAEEYSLSNMVFAGAMPKKDIPCITRTCDMLMTLFDDKPILATNSPNKFFDGLASGRPMLVNSAGWTKTLVEENDCGVYVPAADGLAMADAIERIADDAGMRERMGRNARALAEREFSRDTQAHRLIEVLRGVTTPR